MGDNCVVALAKKKKKKKTFSAPKQVIIKDVSTVYTLITVSLVVWFVDINSRLSSFGYST